MKMVRAGIAVLLAVAALGAVAYAVDASIETVSIVQVPEGFEITTLSTGAPMGSFVRGYMIDPNTGASIFIGAAPVDPGSGLSQLLFPPATIRYRVNLHGPNGELLGWEPEGVTILID